MTAHNCREEAPPSLTEARTDLVSHFLLGARASISCFLKASQILRRHLSSQPEARSLHEELSPEKPQPTHLVLSDHHRTSEFKVSISCAPTFTSPTTEDTGHAGCLSHGSKHPLTWSWQWPWLSLAPRPLRSSISLSGEAASAPWSRFLCLRRSHTHTHVDGLAELAVKHTHTLSQCVLLIPEIPLS